MKETYKNNSRFWDSLDRLIEEKGITVDRPKGSRHDRFPAFVYPFDYGYVNNTVSTDGVELDVWIGNLTVKKVSGILNIIDMDKKDTEMKILYACSPEEMNEIYRINNQMMMHAVMLIRKS